MATGWMCEDDERSETTQDGGLSTRRLIIERIELLSSLNQTEFVLKWKGDLYNDLDRFDKNPDNNWMVRDDERFPEIG
jgi:hypothetical protein